MGFSLLGFVTVAAVSEREWRSSSQRLEAVRGAWRQRSNVAARAARSRARFDRSSGSKQRSCSRLTKEDDDGPGCTLTIHINPSDHGAAVGVEGRLWYLDRAP